uniref:U-box domain-containing protein n=1 Tax=Odontella aurita TaxID=265563 RepID=A0A7S4JN92_9STRA|mmetsp:Transcript_50253/g.151291  ORF Transcript_50253/g.151291 Transcript_50253/m.151291 type:complete len:485 (+) Transcript_50253:154-1608(+)
MPSSPTGENLDELPEPDYDFDFDEASVPVGELGINIRDYILGTLVVNVVAGRNLFYSSRERRLLEARSVNPYAVVYFGSETQRTSAVHSQIDPVWPREEQSYFDVTVQVEESTQENQTHINIGTDGKYPTKPVSSGNASVLEPSPTVHSSILTVGIFHAKESYKNEVVKRAHGSSECNDDPFLGSFSVDISDILTGKSQCIDEWNALQRIDGSGCAEGEIRILCEYEPADPPPRPGDMCRFITGFCEPIDLFPVPAAQTFRVDDVDGDEVILSYKSPEGWLCTFQAHRFMVVCASRHQAAVERYRDEMAKLAEKVSCSPLAQSFKETVHRVPDDGILFIGAEAAIQSGTLVSRWFQGGVATAVSDIIYAVNLDGQHSPHEGTSSNESSSKKDEGTGLDHEGHDAIPLSGMPCCPITGQPMLEPVVASDGHTYERKAIARWLESSSISPLTGSTLPHKELVPNYLLLSSCQHGDTSSEPRQNGES